MPTTKPVDVHTTSSEGTRATLDPRDGRSAVQPLNKENISHSVRESKDTAERLGLPANQSGGTINWLGSSYTGQDIKVVAHLYADQSDQPDTTVANLERERDRLEASQAPYIGITSSPYSVPERQLRDKIARDLDNQINALNQQISEIKQRNQEFAQTTTITLGTLQTLSVQSVREKYAVRALGHAYAKAYTRGTRTLAGSMIFTLFEEHPLRKLITAMGASNARWHSPEISSLIPDQLPPIDLTIIFANEYGSISEQRLYGVEFVNDSATYSIENLLTEEVLQFTCRDIDIMTAKGQRKLIEGSREYEGTTTATSLFKDDDYQKYLERLGLRRRLTNR